VLMLARPSKGRGAKGAFLCGANVPPILSRSQMPKHVSPTQTRSARCVGAQAEGVYVERPRALGILRRNGGEVES
jgi:hypothetical protein